MANAHKNEETSPRGNRKERYGTVVGDARDKTIAVDVARRSTHPLYKKVVKSTKRYKVHDENNEARAGDVVSIIETRPLSKTKHWRLKEIMSRSES